MKWKKLMAGILSAAMVVTSISPVSAAVEAEPVEASTQEVAVDAEPEETTVEENVAVSDDLALSATPTASYTSDWETVEGINNPGFEPTTSAFGTGRGWGNWSQEPGTVLWVSYTWDKQVTVGGNEVYWYDDGGDTGVPSAMTMEYLDGEGNWQPMTITSENYFNKDQYNIINVEPVETTSIRMNVTVAQGKHANGVGRWKVYSSAVTVDEVALAKKELAKILDRAEALNESVYTAESWAVLKTEVEKAQAVMEKEDTTLEEVEAAMDAVTAAINGLAKDAGKVESIDHYVTTTAAGVAPILPDSVVANGLVFDDPTTSVITRNNNVNLGETFKSKLIPVKWEAVAPESYAKAGETFTVKGTATYDGKEYEAYADITVNTPAAVAATNSSVTFENVQLNDAFWAPKQETNATTSLNKAISEIQKASGGEPNFDNAIKKLNGEDYNAFSGYVFQDSDIYKSLEAISYTLSATQNDTNPEVIEQRKFLQDTIERWIKKIEAVQYADGYIDTHFTLRSSSYAGGGGPGTHRWRYFANHEMYVAGHFLESVVAYTRYREGINDPDYRLYVAGKRFADEIVSLFGPNGKRHEVPGHEEIELALVKFGKLAQEYEGEGAGQKYFDTAQTLIDRRGENRNLRDSGYFGDTYSQDKTPFAEEVTARGHSVRAVYYWTAATDIAAMKEDGNDTRTTYMNTLSSIWDAVENRKTYITGGIGTTAPSADSEGFGDDYVLPNAQSYCEICAAIGAANWNQRMNLLYEDGKYADVVERNLYNSILVGTNLDGNRFYYDTLLEVNNGKGRYEWFSCACCPPNLMRTIAALSGYMYNVHNDNLFVNMYVGSNGNVNVNGTNVNLVQETDYPWEGAVKLTVSPEAEKAFTLKVRVPGWVNEQKNQNVSIQVNGEAVEAKAEKGYVAITRTWKAGDVVMIDIPMEVRMTEANPKVETNIGRIALQRGPIVYCMENAGNVQLNPEIADFDVLNLVIPRDAKLTATYNEKLLNGVVELTGDVKYYNRKAKKYVDAKMQAIPYYAWNNRGNDAEYVPGTIKNNSTKMDIWAYADEWSGSTGLRAEAIPSVNYVGWGMGADNFADGSMASFWNGHNDSNLQTSDQWMMYDFGDQKAEISACSINFYWAGDNGVITPNGVTIEYVDENGEWVKVTPTNEWACKSKSASDAADVFEFEPVVTSKIRVTMDHAKRNNSKVAVAVYEWDLTGELVTEDPTEENLILYYNFDLQNSYATEIPDKSGNQNTGELANINGAVEGKYSINEVNLYGKTVKALNLPGEEAGTFLYFPDDIMAGKDSVTISAWVNLSTDNGYQRIWDFGSGQDSYMYLLSDGGNKGFEGYSAAITNSGWSGEKGVSKGTNFDKNRWVLTTVVMDGSRMSLYENGKQIGETVDTGLKASDIGSGNNMLGYSQFGDGPTKGQFAEIKIYDRALTAEEVAAMYDVTDEGIVSADKFELDLGDLSAVTEDFALPAKGVNGSDITWTSENAAIEVVDGKAKVTRPAAGTDNAAGTLTATITYNGKTETKVFDVTVVAEYTDKQIVEHDAEALKKAVGDLSAVMESFNAPENGEWGSTITWASENSAIKIADGIAAVTRPEIGKANAEGVIKATVTYGKESMVVEIPATVIALREAITIKSYEPMKVTTRKGVYPTLPNYVKVTYSDDTTNKLKAVWPTDIEESKYNTVGTFEVEGSIPGEKLVIKATVEVIDEAEAVKVAVSDSFDLSDITLDKIGEDGSILTQNRDRDLEYLKLLDNDRMLYNFRKTFGEDTKGAKPMGGWDSETGLLRGHSTGHYMSALALAYGATGDEELKVKLDEMVSELRRLQKMSKGEAKDFKTNGVLTDTWSKDPSVWGEGFISAYSPDQFALLEQYVGYGGADEGIWAPYYTMHKLLAGFLDAYTYADNEEALEAAKGLGKWAINRLSVLPQEQLTKMWDMYIAGEFGGMNESLAKLYLYTGDEEFIRGAKLFDNTTFFDNLVQNIDDIQGRHANQHIPQIIGAMELYKATAKAGKPETYYYDVASNFWEMVVSRYAYSIGGVGTGEKFTEPYRQANNIKAAENCETCAAYNLMKLTKELNNYNPDRAEYMDYYERTLYNQIVASQTPNVTSNMHNGTTYMLPIGPGQRRGFTTDYGEFTCCHGTGMENHVKYQEAAYVKTADTLYVGLYLPSTVTWADKGVSVKQETVFPSDTSKFIVSALEGSTAQSFSMKLRVPYWATRGMNVTVNGEEVKVSDEVSTYATLEGIKAGDVIEVKIPWSLHLDSTPDKLGSATVSSVMYGPLVMAAQDDNTEWSTLVLSETISDSIKISTDEKNGFPVLTAKGYTFRPMFAPEFASNAYTTYFKTLLIADDGKEWFDVKVNNRTPLNGSITTTAQADMVKDGEDLVITLAPGEGYIAKKLVVNGEEVQDKVVDNVYTVKNVSGPVDVSVSFRPPVLDQNDLEYSASLTCDTWYDWYGSPYNIMKDWEPESSIKGYNGDLAYRNWYTSGRWSWLQYDWDDPVIITKFQIYWAVEPNQSWCDLPADIKVEYLDEAGEWKEATLTSSYEDMTKLNQYNDINFDKITTTAVRLKVKTKPDPAGALGIFRWKVVGEVQDTEIPEVLADFDFDDEETGFTSAYGKATGKHELKDSYAASAGKALYLDESADTFLSVTNKDGGSLLTGVKEMTVSFEMKSDRTGTANWPFYAAPNANEQVYQQEHYIGLLENTGDLTAERFNNSGARSEANKGTASSTDWFRIDLVYTEKGTDLYVNGEKQGETVASDYTLADILGDSSIIQIGKANWTASGEYFKGWIDNYKIVSKALTAEEIKANADAFLKAKPADKTALEKKVNAAISADKKDEYTPETWKAYEDALNAAKAVIAKADATQTEVDEALKTLTEAQKALKKAPKPTPVPADKKALQAAVDVAASKKAEDYTAESWAAMQKALTDAQAVLAKTDATQAEVDAALTAVNAAMNALVSTEKPEPPKIDHSKHIGMTFYVGDLKYKITKDNGKVQEVRVTSLKNKKATKVVIPKKVTFKKLGETFKVTSIKAKAFKGKNIKKVVIGANVTKIGPNAFLNCKKLTTVTIGKSVKTIGTRAFYGCAKLTKVTIKSKVVKNVKKNAFKRISRKAVIKVPKGKKNAYAKRFKGRIAKGVKIK